MKNSIYREHGDKLLFALALTVLAIILIRGAAETGRRINEASAPPIVFTQWWEDDLEKDTLPELIKEFESLHKGIKIVLDRRPYEELRRDLFNFSETASFGDIIAIDPLWVPELQQNKIIESRPDGNSQAPLLSFINVLFYNTEILKEAGFSRPPKSRSEFLAYARTVSGNVKNRRGLAMDGNSSRWVYDDVFPWIWAAGAELIKDGKPAFNSRPVIESLAFLSALEREALISHAEPAGNKAEDFISGRAVFMIAPASYIKLLRERMGGEAFGITAVPSPDNYMGRTFFAGATWTVGINSASAFREEAGTFAAFLSEKALVLSEKTMVIPEEAGAPFSPDPFYSKLWDIAIAGESARDFTGLPWTELEKIFREELSALFAEKASAAETAAAIQEKISPVLGR